MSFSIIKNYTALFGKFIFVILLNLFSTVSAFDVVDYIPLSIDSSWDYESTALATHQISQNRLVNQGYETINGIEAVQRAWYHSGYANMAEVLNYSLWSYDNDYIYVHGENQVGNPEGNEIPLGLATMEPVAKLIKRQVEIGDSYSVTSTLTFPNGETAPVDMNWEILGLESVTVPAGTFEDCLKVKITDFNGSYVIAWHAKNIGEVKTLEYNQDGDLANQHELTAYNNDTTGGETIPESTPETTPEPTPEVSPEPAPEVSPEPTPEVTPEPTPEVTPEPTPEPTSNPVSINNSSDSELSVEEVHGSVITATSVSVDTVHDSVPESGAILTGDNSEVTIKDADNIEVRIKSESLVTQHPAKTIEAQESKKLTLLKGHIEVTSPAISKAYIIETPLAKIIIHQASHNRQTNSAQLSVQYEQEKFSGNLEISVTSGSVKVIDNNNQETTLSAGEELSLSEQVHKSSWVLPIDGDLIYGGRENTLAWMAYPNAAGYLLEYNFPQPVFSDENPATPEFKDQMIYFEPSSYTIYQDIVIAYLIIPDLKGQLVEARIYPIDAQRNVISNSVGSDRGNYTFD